MQNKYQIQCFTILACPLPPKKLRHSILLTLTTSATCRIHDGRRQTSHSISLAIQGCLCLCSHGPVCSVAPSLSLSSSPSRSGSSSYSLCLCSRGSFCSGALSPSSGLSPSRSGSPSYSLCSCSHGSVCFGPPSLSPSRYGSPKCSGNRRPSF
ncbi:hypothetical protein C8J56DRAFT_985837 [Mycena floridula]|nr:hypothetical protein C8J56DRAFT_985837 [Mycena floridula]